MIPQRTSGIRRSVSSEESLALAHISSNAERRAKTMLAEVGVVNQFACGILLGGEKRFRLPHLVSTTLNPVQLFNEPQRLWV
ncbi:hypothetical protein QFZ69_001616 [Arthrobacter sp. V1I7]|nr:hypothetical protein [Arthrobacter sp. V1I7]